MTILKIIILYIKKGLADDTAMLCSVYVCDYRRGLDW
jgi:hypothetical protein